MLKDDHSHTEGSDDMESLVFIGGVSMGYCGTHIYFWVCTLNCTLGFFIRCTLVVFVSNVGGWIYVLVVHLVVLDSSYFFWSIA